MTETLRDRQKKVARETILQATADEIVESGLEDLSLQSVAERAGVAKRTLYNYFDSRENLLAELGRWSDELTLEMGGYLQPDGLDSLPAMIPAVWRTWEAQGSLYEAVVRISAASIDPSRARGRGARRAAISQAVAELRPDLDPDQAGELAALFHALASGVLYRRLTIEDGLNVDDAANLAGWALAVLRDALIEGNDPFRRKEP